MGLINDLLIRVTSDVDSVKVGMPQVRDELQKTQTAVDDTSKSMTFLEQHGETLNTAANFAAAGVIVLIGVLANASRETIALGQSIDDVMSVTNLGSESASRLVGQWGGFGVAANSGANAITAFEKNLDAARRGNDAMVESFARVGVTLVDIKNLSDEDILAKTRDGLSQTAAVGSDAALAIQLFGKSGTELANWYRAAPDDIARVNEQLEKAGLVWGDEQIQSWQDVIDAQREMKIAWLGLQVTIAQDVLPYLPPLIEGFGSMLRVIEPLAPVLVPATVALAGFVVVVKTALIAQQAALAIRGLYIAIGGAQATSTAALGFRILATNIGIMTATAGVSLGVLGALALAVTATTAAVVGAVWAWKQWRDAVEEADKAHEQYINNYSAAEQRIIDKYGAGSEQHNKWKAAVGPQKEAQYDSPWWGGLFGFADGGIAKGPESGYPVMLHGVEKIEPLSSAAAASGGNSGETYKFTITGNHFVGTSRDVARLITDMVQDELGERVHQKTKGVYA